MRMPKASINVRMPKASINVLSQGITIEWLMWNEVRQVTVQAEDNANPMRITVIAQDASATSVGPYFPTEAEIIGLLSWQ